MTHSCRHLPTLCLLACFVASATLPLEGLAEEHEESADKKSFYLGSQRSWFFISFLPNEDDAETLGLEFESYFEVADFSVKNISYFEVADYPRPIPGQPIGNEFPGVEIKTGINDLLTAFWATKKGKHHGKHHLAWGAAIQLPTATTETLGSGKWSAGPSFDYEYESGKLFAGVIGLQLWSFAGDSNRKDVNFFMAKPFLVYQINEKWDALYMPYGISVYWKKPHGENIYLPIGGGFQRHLNKNVNFSIQFFKNVRRPTAGTKYDLRFMLEFVLN